MKKLCRHYYECGGCELQHLNKDQYLEYKYETLAKTLLDAKIFAEILHPFFIVGAYKRRRCTLQVSYHKKKISLGFYKKKSHIVVDMKECFILTPEIFDILQPLRICLENLENPQKIKNVYILSNNSELDLLINADYYPSLKCMENIVKFSANHNIARISWQENKKITSIVINKTVCSKINNIQVALPPASFLQATKECEQYIQQQILALVQQYKVKKVIDLYAGYGTFSLIFDDTIQVCSVEGDQGMSKAMSTAIKQYNLKNKQVICQDLYRYPVNAEELSKYNLAIIDPPRNGASPQIEEIIRSKIKIVMMISCNVDSFIRDAKLLIKGGYILKELTPIDQFHWTKHLELSAIFHFNN
jgi:23S rRNA (uracil1939-C5)-methyltransferase